MISADKISTGGLPCGQMRTIALCAIFLSSLLYLMGILPMSLVQFSRKRRKAFKDDMLELVCTIFNIAREYVDFNFRKR